MVEAFRAGRLYLFARRQFTEGFGLRYALTFHGQGLCKQGVTMRRVLQDIRTGLFYRNAGELTSNASEAFAFRDAIEAMRFSEQHDLGNVRLILKSPGGRGDVLLGFRKLVS